MIKERTAKESKLTVVAINDGTITTLITSNGVYCLGTNGNLIKATPHEKSYSETVTSHFKEIGKRLAFGQFGGEYRIQYDGKLNFPVNLS